MVEAETGLSANDPIVDVRQTDLIIASMVYSTTNKTRLAGCGIMLLLFIGLPITYLAGGAYTETFPRTFSSESWIAASGNSTDDERRCGMLADLKYRVGIEGKTREEVVALLGEPEDRRREPGVSYWLLCPSFMDIWVLGVRWENGRAVQTFVHDT